MVAEQAKYRHDLGNGLYVDAFSLESGLTNDRLAEIVRGADGTKNSGELVTARNTIRLTQRLESMSKLTLHPVKGTYSVPEPLRPYRDALQTDWDSKGRFNGPVLIAPGEIKSPLEVIQGGYYGFAATKLGDEPAKLLPDVYEKGKTVEDILIESGIGIEARAKYFGIAHLMHPSKGDEILLVMRAKSLGIADNIIATPGSTPGLLLHKPGLRKPGFGVGSYWSHHLADEMKDEFHLDWGDFWIGKVDMYEDGRSIPFAAVNIHTELSAEQISERAFGDPRVLKEHNIIYGMPRDALGTFLERFHVFSSVVVALENMQ